MRNYFGTFAKDFGFINYDLCLNDIFINQNPPHKS